MNRPLIALHGSHTPYCFSSRVLSFENRRLDPALYVDQHKLRQAQEQQREGAHSLRRPAARADAAPVLVLESRSENVGKL